MSVELSRLVCSALLNVLTRNGKSTKPRLLSASPALGCSRLLTARSGAGSAAPLQLPVL